MSAPRDRMARRRLALLARVLVVCFAGLLALGPLTHHDVACHLKSATHCTACVSSPAPRDQTSLPLDRTVTVCSDTISTDQPSDERQSFNLDPGDRSPPATPTA
jgi:hypothetical protein